MRRRQKCRPHFGFRIVKAQPSDSELDKIVKRINDGEEWRAIFPGVATLAIDPDPAGPGISLKITKKEGEAVQLVAEGTPGATVIAVRKIDELGYYSLGFEDLRKKLGINRPRLLLLIKTRRHPHASGVQAKPCLTGHGLEALRECVRKEAALGSWHDTGRHRIGRCRGCRVPPSWNGKTRNGHNSLSQYRESFHSICQARSP